MTYANDVHHRTTTRLREIIPDFVESEYPRFVEFITAYYEFLEQSDHLPIVPVFTLQNGVITVQSGNSTIVGNNTTFNVGHSNNTQLAVGSDVFRIRSVMNATSLIVYDIPERTYYANTYTLETSKSTRQASGAIRQLLTYQNVESTLDDFVPYFRDVYLKDLPQGQSETEILLPRILDFYQSRGSEDSYRFLFNVLYGKYIDITYPRDFVFTSSGNEYIVPTIIRLDKDTVTQGSQTANVYHLETREIVGLTSNARTTIQRVVDAYEGPQPVVRLFVDEIQRTATLGDILTESGHRLVATKYGLPPEGLTTTVYPFFLTQETTGGGEFLVGETVSTVPTEDPLAIRGTIVGSVVGFTIESRGSNYQIGDIIYPPTFTGGYNAVGRVAKFSNIDITGVDIVDPGLGYYTGLPLIVDNSGTGGSGFFGTVSKVSPGNILLVGTDGDSGLNDGDTLIFDAGTLADGIQLAQDNEEIGPVSTWGQTFTATREKIDYYELGVSTEELLHGIQLDATDDSDGADLCLAETTEVVTLVQESAIRINSTSFAQDTITREHRGSITTEAGNVVVNGTDTLFIDHLEIGDILVANHSPEQTRVIISIGNNTQLVVNTAFTTTGDVAYTATKPAQSSSPFYTINANTSLGSLVTSLTAYPMYINGLRRELGRVAEISFLPGSGYLSPPTLGVLTPQVPTEDSQQQIPIGTPSATLNALSAAMQVIFGVNFRPASVVVDQASGQLGEIEVLAGGSGYTPTWNDPGQIGTNNNTFFVNSGASTTITGNGAEVGLVLGAVSRSKGRFKNTRSLTSADQHLQSIDYYQPFSYVLSVDENASTYRDTLKRFVHPGGGLMIPRRTISTAVAVPPQSTSTNQLTEPLALNVVSTLTSTSMDGAFGLKVRGNYAYIGSSIADTLTVINIANVSNPVIVASTGGPTPGTSLNSIRNIDVVGQYAYVVNFLHSSLAIIDINNPENPIFISETRGPDPGVSLSGATYIKVQNNYAYITCQARDSLAVIDVSNPYNPTYISEYRGEIPGTTLDLILGFEIVDNYLYAACYNRDSIAVIDISNPANPSLVSEYRGPSPGTSLDGVFDVAIVDNYLYTCSFNRDSIIVVDITDPTNLQYVTEYKGPIPGTTFDGIRKLIVYNDFLICGMATRDSIAIVDITDRENPLFVTETRGAVPGTTLNGPRELTVMAPYIFSTLTDGDGLAIVDLQGFCRRV